MREHVIFLGGFEPAYMRKLALYFNARLGGDMRVDIIHELSEPVTRDAGMAWIGSEKFIEKVSTWGSRESCIVLSEDVSEDASHVFRYQPCERLYQKVMFRYQQTHGYSSAAVDDAGQTWIVITADTEPSSLLAFSVTCAQILGERTGVLYLNLSECSGMEELFMLEQGTDLTDAAAALHKDGEVYLDTFIRRLEQMDYIMPPANPMILHELREQETERLMRAVKQKREYDVVIVAMGCTCCGCDLMFRSASRLIHLCGQGFLSACSRKEWIRFIRLCLGEKEIPVEQINIPPISADLGGMHLLHDWREGALGQTVRACLDKEADL